MARTPVLRDLMRTDLVVVGPQVPLGQAHRLLVQTGVRYLPVVDGGRYRGMVGERYLRPFLAPWAPASVQAQWEAPVARFLQEFPKAHPEESPEEAAFRMEAARVGALPVVEEEVLVGLVTAFDLLRGLLAQNLHLCTLGIVMLGGPLERGRRFPV